MSMSEFDKHLDGAREKDASRPVDQILPADFSEEDLDFMHELNTLFSPEEEELPPLFVQTLMEVENPRFSAADETLVQKTNARVFRALRLRRRLFSSQRSLLKQLSETVVDLVRRPALMAWTASLLLIMLCTAAFAAPSFASGMAYLLHGAKGGVLLVHQYPKANTKHINNANNTAPTDISLVEAQRELHFKIYWPAYLPQGYSLNSINLYQESASWADGPVVELVYISNVKDPNGTGQIVIREFKPAMEVLQVVQDKAAQVIQSDAAGNPMAIYVDGQWMSVKNLVRWMYGGRSEVIYQQDGVVFWIAGDQRDGIGKKDLWNIAQSMQNMAMTHIVLMKGETTFVERTSCEAKGPFSTDMVAIYPDTSSGSPYYINLSSYLTGKQSTDTRAGSDQC
ncbi:MAG TPA: hypothetical protein VFA41_07130 [Ktedonobacteraceae bacterium]|nr:hypothetical protein [Ktedonobacteraceae bacterium]